VEASFCVARRRDESIGFDEGGHLDGHKEEGSVDLHCRKDIDGYVKRAMTSSKVEDDVRLESTKNVLMRDDNKDVFLAQSSGNHTQYDI